MRAPRGKRWLTIFVIVFALMFVVGTAYATLPGALGVTGTVGIFIEADSEDIFLPSGPILPGLIGGGQAPGDEDDEDDEYNDDEYDDNDDNDDNGYEDDEYDDNDDNGYEDDEYDDNDDNGYEDDDEYDDEDDEENGDNGCEDDDEYDDEDDELNNCAI